jgi:hypothetical protein
MPRKRFAGSGAWRNSPNDVIPIRAYLYFSRSGFFKEKDAPAIAAAPGVFPKTFDAKKRLSALKDLSANLTGPDQKNQQTNIFLFNETGD